MPQFILGYLGSPKPASPEAGAAHMGKWKEWMEGLGDSVVSQPSPMMGTKIVSADGVSDGAGPDAMTGYMVVEVADMDAALVVAKTDPYLNMIGAKIQVAELKRM